MSGTVVIFLAVQWTESLASRATTTLCATRTATLNTCAALPRAVVFVTASTNTNIHLLPEIGMVSIIRGTKLRYRLTMGYKRCECLITSRMLTSHPDSSSKETKSMLGPSRGLHLDAMACDVVSQLYNIAVCKSAKMELQPQQTILPAIKALESKQ